MLTGSLVTQYALQAEMDNNSFQMILCPNYLIRKHHAVVV